MNLDKSTHIGHIIEIELSAKLSNCMEGEGMRKLLFLAIVAFAVPFSSQVIARSDKSIGHKCYKSYHKEGGNQVAACIYQQCQQKYKNQNINFQIQCQTVANKEFLDLVSKSQGK